MKKYILKQKYTLFLAVFLTLFCSFLNILIVYIIQNLVDSITKTEISTFQWMLFLLLLVLITNFIIGYVSIFVEAKISKKIHLDLKQDLFQSVLCQKYEDFRLTSTGSKISVFENDINFLEEYYFNNIFVLMRNTIVLTVSLIYLFLLNIVVGIILLISAFLVLLIPLLLGKNIDAISEKYSRKKGEFISGLKDFFEGMDVIHDYQIEKQTYKNYSDILNNLENQLFILKKKIGLYNQTMVFGNYIIIAVSFIAGGYLVINKVISIGEMIAITQVMNIIMQPVGEVVSALIEMTGSKSVKKKLENMIEKKKEIVIKIY
ncbi:ABC transporter transmembrane region [Kandleria vitulina]|uniref:ABC transporter transmembrane domain-containing protein n=1 Tax=Kandleria vitulina TaxID=1630 RepID=UPI0008B051E1|nr:ABC transporter ATP-binding protein [Kandleria vitulina]SEJ28812.1 ABC transporter transmembrane region [Kandleria vitulina]